MKFVVSKTRITIDREHETPSSHENKTILMLHMSSDISAVDAGLRLMVYHKDNKIVPKLQRI